MNWAVLEALNKTFKTSNRKSLDEIVADQSYDGLYFDALCKTNDEHVIENSNRTIYVVPPDSTRVNSSEFSAAELYAVLIPRTVSIIQDSAFKGSTIEFAVIPSSVQAVDMEAFAECGFLKSVFFKGKPEFIDTSAFDLCINLSHIYVPWSQGELADAPWGATNAVIHYDWR